MAGELAPAANEEATWMNKTELQGKVCKILADNLSVPEDEVKPESRFQEDSNREDHLHGGPTRHLRRRVPRRSLALP